MARDPQFEFLVRVVGPRFETLSFDLRALELSGSFRVSVPLGSGFWLLEFGR